GRAPRDLGQFCSCVSVDERCGGGTTSARYGQGGRGGNQGPRGGDPRVLQRRLHVFSGGAHRRLRRCADVCTPWEAGPPTQAPLCTPSRSALWTVGETEAARHAADAPHPRRAGRRTLDTRG